MPSIIKISELTELTAPADGDNLVIQDISEPIDIDKTKKITFLNLVKAFIPSLISKRQGGSATDWNTAGTTNYTPPATAKIQVGIVSFTVPSSTVTMYVDITFPTSFTYKPLMFVSLNSDTESATTGATPPVCYGENATTTTARIRIKGNGNMYPSTVTVAWMAIGE